MLSDWDYKDIFETKLAEERRMIMELTKWKQEIERATPYSPPLTFEQKIDTVISLLEKYGPKLATLADVMGAMHLDEKDNS